MSAVEERGWTPAWKIELESFRSAAASAKKRAEGLQVTTSKNKYLYAVVSPARPKPVEDFPSYKLKLDVTLEAGGLSVSVLDTTTERMVFGRPITWPGRRTHYFPLDAAELPAGCKIVISNHRDLEEAVSRFTLHGVEILGRSSSVA
jgi:hypothetical protein